MQQCSNKQLPSEREVSLLYVKVGDACSCSGSLAYLHFICTCMVWSGHTNAIKECRPITVRLHVVIQSKSITEVYTVNLQHRSTCVHCLSHSMGVCLVKVVRLSGSSSSTDSNHSGYSVKCKLINVSCRSSYTISLPHSTQMPKKTIYECPDWLQSPAQPSNAMAAPRRPPEVTFNSTVS